MVLDDAEARTRKRDAQSMVTGPDEKKKGVSDPGSVRSDEATPFIR